jgi:serine/threonine-protein kinase
MLDPRASRFWQSTLLSGLMDVEGLTACWNAIPPEKRDFPEHIDRRLARQAVQAHALTIWQAQQLLAGRTSGFKVDRYVLLDMIGQGGMGRVYLARDTRLNRRVALKILAPERINNPRAIARFQREARVGAQLQHENLVRVYDFGESHGRFYLVMEYIEGRTIGNLITEQGPMPPATAARLIRQIAMGLEHAHRKGLIHRDVNPYNILVTYDGTAKLADLGLAIDLADEERVTREGATVGTFDYVAPEQARHSHAADIRSDIYSLGCTLYHMLAGQVPFPSPSLPEKLFAHQALEPTPLNQLVSGVPEGLVQVVRRMMHKSPDERYATPIQVVLAIEPYADEYAGLASRADGTRTSGLAGLEAESSSQPEGSKDSASPRSPVTMAPVSSRSDEAKDLAVPGSAAEPARAGLPPVAVPVAISTPTKTETGSGSAPRVVAGAGEPAVPLLTPVDDSVEAEPAIPLVVDLGPEPSLSEGLPRAKSRLAPFFPLGSASVFTGGGSGSDGSATASDGSIWWLTPRWLWGLVALAAVATVLVVLLGLSGVLGWIMGVLTHANSDELGLDQENQPAIFVRTGGLDEGAGERAIPAADLLQAMETAMGSRGYVELRNRQPLCLEPGRTCDLGSARGRLVIRAAPGVEPVLEVELSGARPFLTTGSGVSLILSGLTIVVRYPQPGLTPSPAPPPLIMAAGTVTLDHCAFQVVGSPCLKDSRALVVDGNDLTVEGCWFQGFDRAIKVIAYDGTEAKIQQTMIVAAPGGIQPRATAPGLHGWGVEVQLVGGDPKKVAQRRLVLEHCTVEGAGLLDLFSDLVQSPFQVEVKHCAVLADALLSCSPGRPTTAQVHWLGEDNQYNIRGPDWIVRSGSPGTPAPSTSVTDLESWRAVALERNPILAKIEYLTDPAARSNPPQPQEFAIEVPGLLATKSGADPNQVGPWGR